MRRRERDHAWTVAALLAFQVGCGRQETDTPPQQESNSDTSSPEGSYDDASSEVVPEVFLPLEPSGAHSVVADDNHLYFDQPTISMIRRVDRQGTNVEDVAARGGYLLHGNLIFVRHDRQVTQIDKTTLEESGGFALPEAYFYRHAVAEDAYFAFGVGCENPTRVDLKTGAVSVQPFEAITGGGAQPMLVTDEHVYCANAWTVMRVARDFESPAEVMFHNEAFLRAFIWDDNRIVWLQDGVFGPLESSRFHSIYSVPTDTMVPEELVYVERTANVGAFVHDPSTDCFYYTSAGSKYGNVQRYCEDGSHQLLIDEREVNGGLAIDEDYVYWGERDGIMRLAKPDATAVP